MRKQIAVLIACSVAALGLAGCQPSTAQATPEPEVSATPDLYTGWVTVVPKKSPGSDRDTRYIALYKHCDGSTLVYVIEDSAGNADISVVPNSPDCQR